MEKNMELVWEHYYMVGWHKAMRDIADGFTGYAQRLAKGADDGHLRKITPFERGYIDAFFVHFVEKVEKGEN